MALTTPGRSDSSHHCMENPHAERQAVLLERILKNAVKRIFSTVQDVQLIQPQSKCTESILELNHCVEVCSSTSWTYILLTLLSHSKGDFTRKFDCENCSRFGHQIPEECTIQFRGNERKLVLFLEQCRPMHVTECIYESKNSLIISCTIIIDHRSFVALRSNGRYQQYCHYRRPIQHNMWILFRTWSGERSTGDEFSFSNFGSHKVVLRGGAIVFQPDLCLSR